MNSKTMSAYLNDPQIKTKYLDRVRVHREADELIQGVTRGRTAEGFKGCAVVCTIEQYSHAAYETELGIPQTLARLEDGIFEGLPMARAQQWPEQFLAAIAVGADLSLVVDQFLHWLLVDEADGVIRFAKTDRARTAIQTVGDLYAKKLRGESVVGDTWWGARAAAAVAADAAADADAAAAAAAAAYAAAAASAAYAAAYAAYAAAYAAAAAAAARRKARERQAGKLLEFLAAAPVGKETV